MESAPIDINALPNLPGFRYPLAKPAYHKSQTWGYNNGQRMENKMALPGEKPKFVHAVKPDGDWRSGNMPDSTTRDVFRAASPTDVVELPAWDALDRHVLRFYGSFKEAVVETNIENYRVRKCKIFYYLEDDTCCITEPRSDNSGIPQGTLIRRHRFPAPDGDYLRAEGLQVGGILHVYGKAIRITNCDDFTRSYFESLGLEQPAALEEEVDTFTATRKVMNVKKPAPERTYEKVYREVLLGGGHINTDMQQFMSNDRRVCRFYAVFDDLASPQYERRPFIILYFLADQTVELREVYPLNCGRDNFPIFFRRGKMPKEHKLRGPMAAPARKDELVDLSDLGVGLQAKLVGHNYYIYDADDFTRFHFESELGIVLEAKKDVRLPERAVAKAPTPEYTGYGSWDDSMGSVNDLRPKIPKKDFVKLFANDGKILRFTAKFKHARPEDTERRFVVSFSLFDDCVAIHEPPQRNLGIVTGKFLEKAVHLNQTTGRLFDPADLLPGKTIKVCSTEFEMLDMDEYTRKYAMGEAATRNADLTAVMEKMREGMRQQFPNVRDVFRRFDKDSNGVITLQEFVKACAKFGFHLSEQEVLIIMRHFDARKDGQVTYNEFCDALLDEDYTTEMLASKPALETTSSGDYEDKARAKTEQRVETEKVRKAVRDIGDIIYKHAGTMQKLISEFTHMTHKQVVTVEQIHEALKRIGFTLDVADVQRCVIHTMQNDDMDNINYVEFVKCLVTCFHDMAASR